jgi:hypothetical protein
MQPLVFSGPQSRLLVRDRITGESGAFKKHVCGLEWMAG